MALSSEDWEKLKLFPKLRLRLGLIELIPRGPPAMPPIKPFNELLIVGEVLTFPEPLMLGISRKLNGRSLDARIILINMLFNWYCSKMTA